MHTLLPLQQIYLRLEEVQGGKNTMGSSTEPAATTTVSCSYKYWLMCMIQWKAQVSLLKWAVIRTFSRSHQKNSLEILMTNSRMGILLSAVVDHQQANSNKIKELKDGRFPKCETSCLLLCEDSQAGETQGQQEEERDAPASVVCCAASKTHRHVPWLDPGSGIGSVSWSLPLPDTPPHCIPSSSMLHPPSLPASLPSPIPPSICLCPSLLQPSLLHYGALKVNVCFHLSDFFSTSTRVSIPPSIHLNFTPPVSVSILLYRSSHSSLSLTSPWRTAQRSHSDERLKGKEQ